MICEQMGQTPDPDRLMTNFSDFPILIQNSMILYSKLPDIYISRGMEGSVFGGKDYTGFKSLCDLFNIKTDRDVRTALFVCSYIESKSVKRAQAQINNQ